MPYQINKWNGDELTVLEDGRINANTSIKLVGRNYSGYGEIQNENFLFLLENFAASGPPPRPIVGQIYYNTETKILNLYDGNDFQPISAASIVDTPSTTPAKGELWVKNSTKQLFIYDGTTPYSAQGWQLIGPEAVEPPFGVTRLVSATVRDLTLNLHAVSKLVVDDIVLAILSTDIFTINSLDAIAGFSSITKGINLSSLAGFQGDVSGNAGSADQLRVSRKINGVDFNGTADISVSATLLNSLSRGTHLIGGSVGFNGSASGTWSVDASTTLNGKIVLRDIIGNFSANEITANLIGNVRGDVTGDVYSDNGTKILESGTSGSNAVFTGNVTGNVTGNATTTTRLIQPRTINGVAFDGTENITVTAGTSSGLTAGAYINVNGGSGSVYNGSAIQTWSVKADPGSVPLHLVARDAEGDFAAREITAAKFIGNADTATKFALAKNINGVAFDGTQSITISDNTKMPNAGGQFSGFVTLHARPTQLFHAATKEYVDFKTKSVEDLIPPIFISLDTRGLNETTSGPGTVVELLNTLAPANQFAAGVLCRVASTIQNVSTSVTSTTGRFIGRSFLTGVSVATTVHNPSRNNDLIYRTNSARTSWEYVSG